MNSMNWHGYKPWGNFGDGLWRVSPPNNPQGNVIQPAPTLQEAHRRLLAYLEPPGGGDQSRPQ